MRKEKNNGWNYRVIKIKDKKLKNIPQTYSWGIYEVYYTDNIPTSWSENPMHPIGESWNELYKDYSCFHRAFQEKTLELKDGKLVAGEIKLKVLSLIHALKSEDNK